MRKIILTIAGFFFCQTMLAQTCIDDVWQCLRTNQAPKARKFVEECLKNNPDNAQVWLMRANVYIQLYDRDMVKMQSDPNYVPRFPDAVMIANESFIKSLELDPKIEPKTGMLAPRYGQQLCAEPLYREGFKALKDKNYEKAIQYINIAARNYELGNDADSRANAITSHIALATACQSIGDTVNYLKSLKKAAALGSTNPSVYTSLYDHYKAVNDIENCKNILEKGLKNVPADKHTDLISAQMDFYTYSGQKEALITLCDTVIKNNSTDTVLIANCANYLSNIRAYEKAEEILNNMLAIAPKSFDLNFQMGYRYYMDATDYEALRDTAMAAKDYGKVNELRTIQNSIMQKAHEWCQKAYEINNNNQKNNIMLQRLKILLRIPVPDELKAKVDSYRIR